MEAEDGLELLESWRNWEKQYQKASRSLFWGLDGDDDDEEGIYFEDEED